MFKISKLVVILTYFPSASLRITLLHVYRVTRTSFANATASAYKHWAVKR